MTVGAGMLVPSDFSQADADARVKEEKENVGEGEVARKDKGDTRKGKGKGKETALMKRGRRRIVWEVAVGCLGLAVKASGSLVRTRGHELNVFICSFIATS